GGDREPGRHRGTDSRATLKGAQRPPAPAHDRFAGRLTGPRAPRRGPLSTQGVWRQPPAAERREWALVRFGFGDPSCEYRQPGRRPNAWGGRACREGRATPPRLTVGQ